MIQKEIKQPLADELLFGKLAKGGTVKVGVKTKDGKKVLDLEAQPDGEIKRAKPARKTTAKKAPARTKKGKDDGKGGSRQSVPKVPAN